MRITVIGAGHVGLVTAATLAHLGHDVACFDADRAKIETIDAGRLPFFEPGLEELVRAGRRSGRLRFSAEPGGAIPGANVAFICVGTPGRSTGAPNLCAVEVAAASLATWATGPMVVVEKATVPVQTAVRIAAVLARLSPQRFFLVSNPEFLREGRAVEDSLHPDRVLVGGDSDEAHRVMEEVYAPLVAAGTRYFRTDVATAELAKHACNAFLALKVSFANGIARVCEAAGADVVTIAEVMGSDPRIGRAFLDAGLGWGGSCFPKDLAAFKAQATRLGYHFGLLDEIVKLNDEALDAVVTSVEDTLWNLETKHIVLLGLAFKPGTDDVRESPALRLAQRLLEAGATVTGVDPLAGEAARQELPGLSVSEDVYAAAEGAHCLVVATEWPEFRNLDLVRLKGIMSVPVIVDGRNLFDPASAAEAGFTYRSVGRPPPDWTATP